MDKKQMASRNLFFGDGHFWKHPETREFKGIWHSINADWLEKKRELFEGFCSNVVVCRKAGAKNCFPNAKTLYELRTFSDPIFSAYHNKKASKLPQFVAEVLEEMTLDDFALWYFDDGCLVRRTDSGGYRYSISVGNLCGADEALLYQVRQLTGLLNVGRVYKNNSRATERNKSYIMTNAVGEIITSVAMKFAVPSMMYKIPRERLNDQPKGVASQSLTEAKREAPNG